MARSLAELPVTLSRQFSSPQFFRANGYKILILDDDREASKKLATELRTVYRCEVYITTKSHRALKAIQKAHKVERHYTAFVSDQQLGFDTFPGYRVLQGPGLMHENTVTILYSSIVENRSIPYPREYPYITASVAKTFETAKDAGEIMYFIDNAKSSKLK